MANSEINIEEINRNLNQNYIHYDPDRVDYTINNEELNLLEQVRNNIWKDVFLASFSLGIPSLINGYCDYSKIVDQKFTPDIFLNFLIGGICFGLSMICFIVWMINRRSFKKLITQIKNKPKYRIPGTNIF